MSIVYNTLTAESNSYSFELRNMDFEEDLGTPDILESIVDWIDYCEKAYDLLGRVSSVLKKHTYNPNAVAFLGAFSKLVICKKNIQDAEMLIHYQVNNSHLFKNMLTTHSREELISILSYMYESRYVYALEHMMNSAHNYIVDVENKKDGRKALYAELTELRVQLN